MRPVLFRGKSEVIRPLLHVLTDPVLARGRSHRDVAEAALRGGADVIQLRDKELDLARLVEVGHLLRSSVSDAGKLLVVNDHVEVARTIGADGVHLGPDDLPVGQARELWPRPKILGASARTVERARLLEGQGADYLGVGPVYGTTTKRNAPAAIGLDTIAALAKAVQIPIIGIGGIDAGNAAQVIRAGAQGVAVISSVVGAEDVEAAARGIRQALDDAAGFPLE
ncbi:MAG TPA: thiamine phosphate synthase [bacterium]|nr:thiamine phosphate synthase [bacterium]